MEQAELHKLLRGYTFPDTGRSIIQTSIALGLYFVSLTIMIVLLNNQVYLWIIILWSILSSPVVVKLFIIFHDCCHTSYFKSRRACFWLGHFLGILTFTAYSDWQRTHAIHHRFMANLEKRGVGDVWLLTVDEYRSADWWTKLRYRFYRHPAVMLLISPLFLFLILNRFPSKGFRAREMVSVLVTDSMIVLVFVGASLIIGWKGYFLIVLPMMVGASVLGVWLFYIQHQFRSVYWAHDAEWDRYRAAMEGSSLYMMPVVFRWFSGNIGYHHIHHLAPSIPNYRLKECYDAVPELREIDPVSWLSGLRNMCLSLWDEQSGLLVSFKEARAINNKKHIPGA